MKKYVFGALIMVSIIVKLILNNIGSIELSRILIFCLTVPFYVITFVYYRRSKLILAFVFVGIFSLLGYTFTLASPMMKILGSISLFGSIINIGLAFAILLLTNKSYSISILLMGLAIFNFLFLSYINYYLVELLFENLDMAEPQISIMENFLRYYNIVFIVVQFVLGIMQVSIIWILDHYQELKEHPLSY